MADSASPAVLGFRARSRARIALLRSWNAVLAALPAEDDDIDSEWAAASKQAAIDYNNDERAPPKVKPWWNRPHPGLQARTRP